MRKTFQVIAPTRSNYWRKMWKIAINRPFFFSAIIELVRELVISNMHNKFEKDTWKFFQVIAPTRSNYWRKRWKIAISRPFWIFFQPLLNLSEKWSLVTCKTNLGRKHEKLFKLSRPQVNVNADADDFNCNSPPFLIKIKRRAKKLFRLEHSYFVKTSNLATIIVGHPKISLIQWFL